MGIAYERGAGFHKDFHSHDRPMIVMPRGSSVITVTTAGGRTATHRIGAASAFIVPRARAFASPSTLLRHFRGDTGTSPHAYVKARRLEEARRLLEADGTPVGDVATLVGYENFAAFSTAFKRRFGAPPSSFRVRSRR